MRMDWKGTLIWSELVRCRTMKSNETQQNNTCQLLTRFVAEASVRCPACGASLEEMVGERCPSCRSEIALSLADRGESSWPYVLLLASVGFLAFRYWVADFSATLNEVAGVLTGTLKVGGVGASLKLLGGIVFILALVFGSSFRRTHLAFQWLAAGCIFAICASRVYLSWVPNFGKVVEILTGQ